MSHTASVETKQNDPHFFNRHNNQYPPSKTHLPLDSKFLMTKIPSSITDIKKSHLESMLQVIQRYAQTSEMIKIPKSKDNNRTLIANKNRGYICFTECKNKNDPLIGKGTTKKVKLCLSTHSGEINALIIVQISKPSQQKFHEHEITLLQRCKNLLNLLQIQDHLVLKEKIYMITEYCNLGDLQNCLNHQKKGELCKQNQFAIAKGIILGVANLHASKILQQDLKPENILLAIKNGKLLVKIGDLGCSIHEDDPIERKKLRMGTAAFLAIERQASFIDRSSKSKNWNDWLKTYQPEIFNQIQTKGPNDHWIATQKRPSDIWSLAIILYMLFHKVIGTPPSFQKEPGFLLNMQKRIISLDERQIFEELKQSGIHYKIQLILEKTLQIEPQKRLSALETYNAFCEVQIEKDSEDEFLI